MKLYMVIESYPYEGGAVLGVFDSKELAKKRVNEWQEEFGKNEYIFIKKIILNDMSVEQGV